MAKFTDERVTAVLLGTRAPRVVVFPGTEGRGDGEVQIAVRLLSDTEIDHARTAAQDALVADASSRKRDPQLFVDLDPEYLERLVMRQVIVRAFVDPDTLSRDRPEPFFPTVADVARLDSTTLGRLFALYLEHQAWVCPHRAGSEEEVTELEELLGKGLPAPALLGRFEHATLVRLLISTARRRAT